MLPQFLFRNIYPVCLASLPISSHPPPIVQTVCQIESLKGFSMQ